VVERLDLSAVTQDYPEEGWPAYAPALLVNVWLYAYALGTTSCWRLERRVREARGVVLSGRRGQPDFWTFNARRQRHPKALDDLFRQVLGLARASGL
jgi:transposase